jgi:hypothetical protein
MLIRLVENDWPAVTEHAGFVILACQLASDRAVHNLLYAAVCCRSQVRVKRAAASAMHTCVMQ